MRNLLKRLVSRYAVFLIAETAVLAGFEFLMCMVISSLDVPGLFARLRPPTTPPV